MQDLSSPSMITCLIGRPLKRKKNEINKISAEHIARREQCREAGEKMKILRYTTDNTCKLKNLRSFISARCNIYISRLCHDASPSVRLSVTEVHWRIIANLGFKFRSHFTAHWPPCGCGRRAACGRIISRHASQC